MAEPALWHAYTAGTAPAFHQTPEQVLSSDEIGEVLQCAARYSGLYGESYRDLITDALLFAATTNKVLHLQGPAAIDYGDYLYELFVHVSPPPLFLKEHPMAEPVYHDIPTNPCSRCAGERQVAEMSWRDPACSVTCVGCANMAVGDSVDAAIDAWDEANPERDVSPDESQAVKEQIVARLLTPPMLHAMTLAADAFDGTDEERETVGAFVAWCQTLLTPQ